MNSSEFSLAKLTGSIEEEVKWISVTPELPTLNAIRIVQIDESEAQREIP